MTVHGGIEFGTARIRFQFQFGIKGEDFEEVTVRARWRTGATVIAFTKVVPALGSHNGDAILLYVVGLRIHVEEQPVVQSA